MLAREAGEVLHALVGEVEPELPRDPGHSALREDIRRAERTPAGDRPGGTTGRFHYSGGIGWPQSNRFEINGAADVSSRSVTLSVSIIVRFGRLPPRPSNDPQRFHAEPRRPQRAEKTFAVFAPWRAIALGRT